MQYLRGPPSVLPLGYVCSQGSQDPSSVGARWRSKSDWESKQRLFLSLVHLLQDRHSDSGKFELGENHSLLDPTGVKLSGGQRRRRRGGSCSIATDALRSSRLPLSVQIVAPTDGDIAVRRRAPSFSCLNQPHKKIQCVCAKACSADDQCVWQPHLKL